MLPGGQAKVSEASERTPAMTPWPCRSSKGDEPMFAPFGAVLRLLDFLSWPLASLWEDAPGIATKEGVTRDPFG